MLGLGCSIGSSPVIEEAWSFSNSTKSLSFDGTDDTVTFGFANIYGTGDFTISAWVKCADFDAGRYIITHYDSSNLYHRLFITSAAKIKFQYHNAWGSGGDSTFESSAITNISNGNSDDEWIHIAITYDRDAAITFYFNGDSVSSITTNLDTDDINGGTSNNLLLAHYDGSGSYTAISIDELSVHDAALSGTEIGAMYNDGTPIDLKTNAGDYTSQSNLRNWWRMGDGVGDDGTNVRDQKGSFHGVISGATIATDAPAE